MKSDTYKEFRKLVDIASKKDNRDLLFQKTFFVSTETGDSLSLHEVDSNFGQLDSVMLVCFQVPVEIYGELTSLSIMLGKFDMIHRNIPVGIDSNSIATHYYFSPEGDAVRKFIRLPNSLPDTRYKIDSDKKGSLYKDQFVDEDEILLLEIIKEAETRLL